MNREVGFGRKLLQVLEDLNISWDHMPTGIDDLSIILRSKELTPIKEQEILNILGYSNSYRLNEIKRCKCKNLDKLLKTFYEYEYKLKDGSSFLPDIKDLTHDMLIKITVLMRG